MDWYLVRSKTRQECLAEANLHRWGVESFCPQIRQTKLKRGKKQAVITPLFPSYLFSRFDFGRDYRKVTYAHGVADVVMFGMTPAKVDEEIIEGIRAKMEEGFIRLNPSSLTSGDAVRIQEGPFKGLLAVFERELTGTQRVALLLKSVSYHARLVVDRDLISPAAQI
jgi:transcriptional antiterminator RfaH